MSACLFPLLALLLALIGLPPLGVPSLPSFAVKRVELTLPGVPFPVPGLATPGLPALGLPDIPTLPIKRPELALLGVPDLTLALATPDIPPLEIPDIPGVSIPPCPQDFEVS